MCLHQEFSFLKINNFISQTNIYLISLLKSLLLVLRDVNLLVKEKYLKIKGI